MRVTPVEIGASYTIPLKINNFISVKILQNKLLIRTKHYIQTRGLWYLPALLLTILLLFILIPRNDKENALIELNASVTFNGERFIVSNNDTIDFLNTEMTLNKHYKITGMNLQARESYTIWPVEFIHINGTNFASKQVPMQFAIWCELNEGQNGFYSRKLK